MLNGLLFHSLSLAQNMNLFSMPASSVPLSPPPYVGGISVQAPPALPQPLQPNFKTTTYPPICQLSPYQRSSTPVPVHPVSQQHRLCSPYFESSSIYAEVAKNLEFMTDDASVRFFKTNSQLRPPFSDISLISMAIYSYCKHKVSFPEICCWIENTFPYYKQLKSDWRTDIKNYLTISKCFQKVPRRKEESEKGGFWRFSNEFLQYLSRNTNLAQRIISDENQFFQHQQNQLHQLQQQQQQQHIGNYNTEECMLAMGQTTTESSGKLALMKFNSRKRNISSCIMFGDDNGSAFKVPRKDVMDLDMVCEDLQQLQHQSHSSQSTGGLITALPSLELAGLGQGRHNYNRLQMGGVQHLLLASSSPSSVAATSPMPALASLFCNTTSSGSISNNISSSSCSSAVTSPAHHFSPQTLAAAVSQFPHNTIAGSTSAAAAVNSFIQTQPGCGGGSALFQHIMEAATAAGHNNSPVFQTSITDSPICCPEETTEEEFLSGKATRHNFLPAQIMNSGQQGNVLDDQRQQNRQQQHQHGDLSSTGLLLDATQNDFSLADLSITGVGIKPPDWWSQSLSASQISLSKLGCSFALFNSSNGGGGGGGDVSPFVLSHNVSTTAANAGGPPGDDNEHNTNWYSDHNLEDLDVLFGLS